MPTLLKLHAYFVFVMNFRVAYRGLLSLMLIAGIHTPLIAQENSPAEETSPEVLALLDSVEHALHSVSYRGIYTYEHAGVLESIKVTHTIDESKEAAKLEHLTGRLSKPIVYRSDLGSCQNALNPHAGVFSRDNLTEHYHFRPLGFDRIAGRQVVVLNADPKDEYRFRYQVAIDRQTGLPLLLSLVDGENLLERFQFIEFDPITELPVPEVAVSGEDYLLDGGCRELANSSRWRLAWLPSGFRLVSVKLNQSADMLSYSDGISRFSIFVSETPNGNTLEGEARRGGTFVYLDKASAGSRIFQVAVVGEVPEATLRKLAASVRPK